MTRPFKSRAFRSLRNGGLCARCEQPIKPWFHWVQFDADRRIVHANCSNPANDPECHVEE